MGTITLFTSLTLDGVMQAPGRPDEDTRGGFRHGGWAVPYNDPVMGKIAGEGMAGGGSILLGRRTYQDFAGYWPKQKDNPFTEALNRTQKYVASNTLKEPLSWQNSTLIKGDVPTAVARLRAKEDLVVLGSGELAQALMRNDLLDRYMLLIHPLVLGTGGRLFRDGSVMAKLRLVGPTAATTKGVVIGTYEPVRGGHAT
jgi:dihydrofolate reductase